MYGILFCREHLHRQNTIYSKVLTYDQGCVYLRTLKVLIDKLEEAITPRVLKPKIVQRRQPRNLRHFKTDTEISFKHDMKNRWTDLEISTSDRPGLLASICQVFLKHGALIKKARIATYGEKAEDRFSISSKQDTPFIKRNDLNNLIEDIKVSLN